MSAPATSPTVFAQPSALATYMGVSEDELNTAQAAQALAVASAAVRAYCRWDVAAATSVSFEIDTGDSGGPCLMIPALNLTKVESVTVTRYQGSPVPITDFVAFEAGYLRRYPGWPALSRIVVVADVGFDPVPDVVSGVTCSVASRNLATAGLGPVGQVRVDGVSTTYGKNSDVADTAVLLLPGEELVLDAFRVPLAS